MGGDLEDRRLVSNNLTDVMRRLDKMEEHNDRLTMIISQLEKAVTSLTIHIEQMKEQDLSERVRILEINMSNQSMVTNAIKWLAVTVVGTAIVLGITYLFTTSSVPVNL